MTIYLIIVNYYSADLIAKLARSLPIVTRQDYRVIIVNNSPEDTGVDRFQPQAIILNADRNLGFGVGCNIGLNWVYRKDPNAIAWIINPDTQLTDNALDKVGGWFDKYPDIAIAGTVIYENDGAIWFAGGDFEPKTGTIAVRRQSKTETDCDRCDWISGCSLLLNFSNFPTCPQFDPAYFLYYEDFDLCRRYATLGYKIAIAPNIGIIHSPSRIANRNLGDKFKYSTHGYLLALHRYAHPAAFYWRLMRLLARALTLLPFKTAIGLGKLAGVVRYGQRSIRP